MIQSPQFTITMLMLAALSAASGGTAPPGNPPAPAPIGICDRIWAAPTLYKSADNPWLQELALQGQLQTQYAYGSDASGHYGSGDMAESSRWGDVEVRRFRLGLRARLFQSLKFHSLIGLEPELSPRIYRDVVEMYLTYAPTDAFSLSVGKAELKFTREQEVSSREILPFERSQIVNQFYGGELTGAWCSGKGLAGGWGYELGVYGNDRQDEFSDFDGGAMILGKVAYNYKHLTSFDVAQAAVHYLHNTAPGYRENAGHLAASHYGDCVALSNDLVKGGFSLATECFWGDGANGRQDVLGLTIMPAWYLTECLQLMTTLQFATSGTDNGLFLPARYEGLSSGAGDKRGDDYLAAYAGLNYYIYGHKLKLMGGVKYTRLDGGPGGGDFDGWTGLVGCRLAF